MRTLNTGVVSPIPPCVIFKMPLARKATGNHLMNSTFLEKLRAASLVAATLEIEYATEFKATLHVPLVSYFQFTREETVICSIFCLFFSSKSIMNA